MQVLDGYRRVLSPIPVFELRCRGVSAIGCAAIDRVLMEGVVDMQGYRWGDRACMRTTGRCHIAYYRSFYVCVSFIAWFGFGGDFSEKPLALVTFCPYFAGSSTSLGYPEWCHVF